MSDMDPSQVSEVSVLSLIGTRLLEIRSILSPLCDRTPYGPCKSGYVLCVHAAQLGQLFHVSDARVGVGAAPQTEDQTPNPAEMPQRSEEKCSLFFTFP